MVLWGDEQFFWGFNYFRPSTGGVRPSLFIMWGIKHRFWV